MQTGSGLSPGGAVNSKSTTQILQKGNPSRVPAMRRLKPPEQLLQNRMIFAIDQTAIAETYFKEL